MDFYSKILKFDPNFMIYSGKTQKNARDIKKVLRILKKCPRYKKSAPDIKKVLRIFKKCSGYYKSAPDVKKCSEY